MVPAISGLLGVGRLCFSYLRGILAHNLHLFFGVYAGMRWHGTKCRDIPTVCLVIMLIASIALIIQSLVLKKEKIVEFDWSKEKPAILLIIGMCIYVALMLCIGYVLASIIVFVAVQFYCGERKPGIYIYTIVAAVLIFLMFKNIFNISLPSLGFLGGLI